MRSERFQALRVNIQDDDLTLDGMTNLIYFVLQKMRSKPEYEVPLRSL